MKNNRLFILLGAVILLAVGGYFILNSNRGTSSRVGDETVSESQISNLTLSPPANCDIQTPPSTEGPYYKPGSPQRKSLVEEGSQGELLIVTGFVFDENCKPVEGAWLDFWQADENGVYDNTGFKLRGHQFTDSGGKYYLETILPKRYSGRTPHIHIKVRKNDNSQILTAQLYFPDAESNQTDSIFTEQTVLSIEEVNGQKVGYYNFVISE